MNDEPKWQQRLQAWSDRPPRLEPDEARRRILQRLERRETTAWSSARWLWRRHRLFALTSAAAVAVVLASVVFDSTEPRDKAQQAAIAQDTTLVLELSSGSTLYLSTQEISR